MVQGGDSEKSEFLSHFFPVDKMGRLEVHQPKVQILNDEGRRNRRKSHPSQAASDETGWRKDYWRREALDDAWWEAE